jgi:hypothetical protein
MPLDEMVVIKPGGVYCGMREAPCDILLFDSPDDIIAV